MLGTGYETDLLGWAREAHGVELAPIEGGFHVKPAAVEGLCIDVMRMIFNWRVVRSDHTHWFMDRGWCYQGTGRATFLRALGAAIAWDGADNTQPTGWIKRAC